MDRSVGARLSRNRRTGCGGGRRAGARRCSGWHRCGARLRQDLRKAAADAVAHDQPNACTKASDCNRHASPRCSTNSDRTRPDRISYPHRGPVGSHGGRRGARHHGAVDALGGRTCCSRTHRWLVAETPAPRELIWASSGKAPSASTARRSGTPPLHTRRAVMKCRSSPSRFSRNHPRRLPSEVHGPTRTRTTCGARAASLDDVMSLIEQRCRSCLTAFFAVAAYGWLSLPPP
ncbi:MAG: hypothetical protein QOJ92_2129 [Frankiales bacterium]|nr:hypothetical protein [Frankiales bacterium]